jgi:hypothetical protein
MYWPFAQILFTLCVCATFVYIILLGINKSTIRFPQMILFTYIFSLSILAYMHSYRIYYFFSLNTLLNKEHNTINYKGWDKYSWFLYLADKKEEALEANQNAQNAIIESQKINAEDPDAAQFSPYIIQHEYDIKQENWTNYSNPQY